MEAMRSGLVCLVVLEILIPFASGWIAVPSLRAPTCSFGQHKTLDFIIKTARASCAYQRRSHLKMGFDIPLGGRTDNNQKQQGQPMEVLLGQLAFSDPRELPKLVESNLLLIDDDFFSFIDTKIRDAHDKEERETLSLLKDAVEDLRSTILKAVQAGVPSSTPAASEAASAFELGTYDAETLALATYDKLILDLQTSGKDGPAALASAVEAAFDRMDMRFLERLSERLEQSEEGAERETLSAMSSAIQSCMSQRIQKASQALQTVLRGGTPDGMTRQLMLLNAKGGLDSNVIMLLEANIDQARKAGAEPAVKVMTMLRDKAMEFKDQSMPDEVRVIRQLLRTEDPAARQAMLAEAFRPREAVFLSDGKKQSKAQAVDGRKFVRALGSLMEKFGNVDDKFMAKLQEIAREAQAVATQIFGPEEKDVRTRQDDAWSKGAVSVWDLESVEEKMEATGEEVPWYSTSSGGWDENGNMVIGGDSFKKEGSGKGGNIIF